MATLNEGIANIEKDSALESMYNRLVAGMEAAAQDTLPDFTSDEFVHTSEDGTGCMILDKSTFPVVMEHSIVDTEKINQTVKEHEDISRKNAAYLFAHATVSSLGVSGSGGIGGAVAITGDSMTGKLNTLYGFASGANGIKIMDIYQTTEEDPAARRSIVNIDGELHLDSHGLYINDWNVMSYSNDILSLDATTIALNADVTCSGTMRFGDLTISKDGINYKGLEFYHSGNSNNEHVDWTMKNGTVAGDLLVKGKSTLKSTVSALGGVSLGYKDVPILSINSERLAQLTGDFDILTGGVKFNGNYVIHVKNDDVIAFSAANKILNFGDDNTVKITLQSGLYDDDGEYEMISKFGSAYFPESFKAGHGLGNTLMSTYKVSSENSGVVFHRYLKFYDTGGPGFMSDGDLVYFDGPFRYNTNINGSTVPLSEQRRTSFGYKESTSLYAPLDRISSSLMFETDADFYVFDKPLEGKTSLGITGSKTRLLENQLFFNDSIYWLAIADGVKHYGNAYMTGSIGSVTFSSGFAGSGWKIYKNELTGNISATFDELTIRKKMRLYELEVQKLSFTNGSLWVSDSCSGDIVEEIF